MVNITKKQLVTSLILGDGWIDVDRRDGVGRALKVSASSEYDDYFKWKKDLFNQCFGESNLSEYVQPPNRKGNRMKIYRRFSVKDTKPYHKFLYRGTEKLLNKFLLRMNNSLSLAIWFMDDGNCQSSKQTYVNGRKYLSKCYFRLGTNSFDYSQNEQAIKWFKDNWNFHPNINTQRYTSGKYKGKEEYILRFPVKYSKEIWDTIKDYIMMIPSMKYKFRYPIHFFEEDGSKFDLELKTLENYNFSGEPEYFKDILR